MSLDTAGFLDRFHAVLVDEIRAHRPELVSSPFTVAEIYQELVPYRTHRDRLGVEMNGDYEHLLLRLLAGEGEYLSLEAESVRDELRSELESQNPNTGLFREYAAANVRLNPDRIPEESTVAVETLAPAPDGEPSPAAPPEDATPEDDGAPPTAEEPASTLEDETAADGGGEAETAEASEVGEPVTCLWCRAPLPNRENLNYCPFCGTDVHVVPCPSCGEALEPEWRFCIACGAGVASD